MKIAMEQRSRGYDCNTAPCECWRLGFLSYSLYVPINRISFEPSWNLLQALCLTHEEQLKQEILLLNPIINVNTLFKPENSIFSSSL